MKKSKKILIFTLCFLCFLFSIHEITFLIDRSEIKNDNNPVFIFKKEVYKDDGTTVYYGLGYQIISWNTVISENIDGTEKDGTLKGIETHRFSFYNSLTKGGKPLIKLEFAEGVF